MTRLSDRASRYRAQRERLDIAPCDGTCPQCDPSRPQAAEARAWLDEFFGVRPAHRCVGAFGCKAWDCDRV